MNLYQIEQELERAVSAELSFLRHNEPGRIAGWQKKLEQHVPAKLRSTLYTSFCKAFVLILDSGTPLIEKTYDAKKLEEDFHIHQYAASIRSDKNSMRDFRRSAAKSKQFGALVSAAGGLGMGALGISLPDIPVLLAVILRSIYEISLHYGFSYDTPAEQVFILRLMETALLHGDALQEQNAEINKSLFTGTLPESDREEQIQRTSDALASELLYLKFIQGIPIVGIVGGVSDIICQKKIADYAELKYRRRFLLSQKK